MPWVGKNYGSKQAPISPWSFVICKGQDADLQVTTILHTITMGQATRCGPASNNHFTCYYCRTNRWSWKWGVGGGCH